MKRIVLWLAAWYERRDYEKAWADAEPVEIHLRRPPRLTLCEPTGTFAASTGNACVTYTYIWA